MSTLSQMDEKLASAKRKIDMHCKIGRREEGGGVGGCQTSTFDEAISRQSVAPTAVPMNHASDSTAIMTEKSIVTP